MMESAIDATTPLKRPVGDLNFHIGEKLYKFVPARCLFEDMPYLLQLMVALISQPRLGEVDVESYVNEHRLWHCFEP